MACLTCAWWAQTPKRQVQALLGALLPYAYTICKDDDRGHDLFVIAVFERAIFLRTHPKEDMDT